MNRFYLKLDALQKMLHFCTRIIQNAVTYVLF